MLMQGITTVEGEGIGHGGITPGIGVAAAAPGIEGEALGDCDCFGGY